MHHNNLLLNTFEKRNLKKFYWLEKGLFSKTKVRKDFDALINSNHKISRVFLNLNPDAGEESNYYCAVEATDTPYHYFYKMIKSDYEGVDFIAANQGQVLGNIALQPYTMDEPNCFYLFVRFYSEDSHSIDFKEKFFNLSSHYFL